MSRDGLVAEWVRAVDVGEGAPALAPGMRCRTAATLHQRFGVFAGGRTPGVIVTLVSPQSEGAWKVQHGSGLYGLYHESELTPEHA